MVLLVAHLMVYWDIGKRLSSRSKKKYVCVFRAFCTDILRSRFHQEQCCCCWCDRSLAEHWRVFITHILSPANIPGVCVCCCLPKYYRIVRKVLRVSVQWKQNNIETGYLWVALPSFLEMLLTDAFFLCCTTIKVKPDVWSWILTLYSKTTVVIFALK